MNEIHDLISRYGDLFYVLAFFWAALEGETFVIFAGFAAQRGYLNIDELFVAAWLGSFCGDQLFFWIGRCSGTRIFRYFPRLKSGVERVVGYLEKYATAFIMAYRFMYGIRNVSGIAIGMSRLPWQKFTFLNFIAACVWAITFSGFGYFFGNLISRMSTDLVMSKVHEIMIEILGLFVLLIVVRGIFARKFY